MIASYEGHDHVVKVLLEWNADVHVKDKDKDTALTLASLNGHLNCVKLLLKHGADVTMVNKEGKTAKDIAEEEGHTLIVQLLAEVCVGIFAMSTSGYFSNPSTFDQFLAEKPTQIESLEVEDLRNENERLRMEISALKERDIIHKKLIDSEKEKVQLYQSLIQTLTEEKERIKNELARVKDGMA
jgi:ankyrin repeat protein